VERVHKRYNEKSRWSGARRDIWISNLAEAGQLEGLPEIRQGMGLDIRRFRWIIQPGNDLFLILNHGWEKDLDRRYVSVFDRGTAKLQYTFRF